MDTQQTLQSVCRAHPSFTDCLATACTCRFSAQFGSIHGKLRCSGRGLEHRWTLEPGGTGTSEHALSPSLVPSWVGSTGIWHVSPTSPTPCSPQRDLSLSAINRSLEMERFCHKVLEQQAVADVSSQQYVAQEENKTCQAENSAAATAVVAAPPPPPPSTPLASSIFRARVLGYASPAAIESSARSSWSRECQQITDELSQALVSREPSSLGSIFGVLRRAQAFKAKLACPETLGFFEDMYLSVTSLSTSFFYRAICSCK
jgi:hypothetical protein